MADSKDEKESENAQVDGLEVSDDFVNIDPEYANYSNDVDKPAGVLSPAVDHNVPPAFADEEQSEGEKVAQRPNAGGAVGPPSVKGPSPVGAHTVPAADSDKK